MRHHYIESLPAEWQPFAAVFAALGDPLRQKILLLFEPGEELSIKAVAGLFPQSRTTIVHHLTVLERSGILAVRRRGKEALYSVRPKTVLEALENLRLYILETYPQAGGKEGQA